MPDKLIQPSDTLDKYTDIATAIVHLARWPKEPLGEQTLNIIGQVLGSYADKERNIVLSEIITCIRRLQHDETK